MNVPAKIMSLLTTVIAFFCSVFNIPYYATGDKIDLNNFTMTFEDEFDTLDKNVWSGHYIYGDSSYIRRGGYWNFNMAKASDGKLTIPLKYLENGIGGGGAGWYSCGIDTDNDAKNGFSQKYGYFEVRCILPDCADCWAAFWLLNDNVYNVDGNGKDGSEIDIFESPCYADKKNNAVTFNIHYDGYGEFLKSMGAKKALIKGNPYEEFNTYGLEWNEDGYTFYINGVAAYSTDFGGVSQNPEYMILSLEVGGDNGVSNAVKLDKTKEYDFVIDYVRAYQYKDKV